MRSVFKETTSLASANENSLVFQIAMADRPERNMYEELQDPFSITADLGSSTGILTTVTTVDIGYYGCEFPFRAGTID